MDCITQTPIVNKKKTYTQFGQNNNLRNNKKFQLQQPNKLI